LPEAVASYILKLPPQASVILADHSGNPQEDNFMEKQWVDFRVVKAQISMQMLVEHYALKDLKKSQHELRGRCPIHNGNGERTFHINLTKNVFQCFSCKAKGNVLDFVAAMENCAIRGAALKLAAWFGVGETETAAMTLFSAEQQTAIDKEPSGLINPPLPFQLRIECSHEYGLSRLTPKTLEVFGAGLCISKGTFSGRFVLPLHDEQGVLVGYAGRSLDDSEPKYLFPSSEKGFYKSHLLFNLHRVLESSDHRLVVLVEGFFSAMKLWQQGIAAVSLMGSSLSKKQTDLICQHFSRVVVLLDGDEAGKAGTDECLRQLGLTVWVRAISLPDQSQPDQLPAEDIQTMLASL
jgi:DNA primase